VSRTSCVRPTFRTQTASYPRAVARFLELPLPDAAKRAILWDNCARYYGLTRPTNLAQFDEMRRRGLAAGSPEGGAEERQGTGQYL